MRGLYWRPEASGAVWVNDDVTEFERVPPLTVRALAALTSD
jgi:hypothetical protein